MSQKRTPFRVELDTHHGPISGWVWATSTGNVSRTIEDELGGGDFVLRKVRPVASAPKPKDFEHSQGSRHFVRDLGQSMRPMMAPGTRRG